MGEQIHKQRKDSRTSGNQITIENSFHRQQDRQIRSKNRRYSKRQQERRRRRRRRKRIQQFILLLVVVLAILCVILVIRHKTVIPNSVAELDSDSKSTPIPAPSVLLTTDSDSSEAYDILIGVWDIDGITKYRFDGTGQGALLVSAGEHMFTYEIHGEKLRINFAEEDIHSAEFRFQLDGDTLTWINEDNSIGTIETKLYKQAQ